MGKTLLKTDTTLAAATSLYTGVTNPTYDVQMSAIAAAAAGTTFFSTIIPASVSATYAGAAAK